MMDINVHELVTALIDEIERNFKESLGSHENLYSSGYQAGLEKAVHIAHEIQNKMIKDFEANAEKNNLTN